MSHVSANARLHQLYWDDRKMVTATSRRYKLVFSHQSAQASELLSLEILWLHFRIQSSILLCTSLVPWGERLGMRLALY